MADSITKKQFSDNAFYERLMELRQTKPEVFAKFSKASLLALRQYEVVKAQHTRTVAAPAVELPKSVPTHPPRRAKRTSKRDSSNQRDSQRKSRTLGGKGKR
jgi:hypothetical protein